MNRSALIIWVLILVAGRQQPPPPNQFLARNAPASATDSIVVFQRLIDKTPGTFRYETYYAGDLNGDKKPDVVLVAQNPQLPADSYGYSRRTLLLITSKNGTYQTAATNDQIIDCTTCGGVVGDPHGGVTIKGGYVFV